MPSLYKALGLINAAIHRSQISVVVPASKIVEQVLAILQTSGYIRSFTFVEPSKMQNKKGPATFKNIEVALSFFDNAPVLKGIKSVSTPSRRCYVTYKMLKLGRINTVGRAKELYLKGFKFNFVILSTSQGIMTAEEAIKRKIGGEVLSVGTS